MMLEDDHPCLGCGCFEGDACQVVNHVWASMDLCMPCFEKGIKPKKDYVTVDCTHVPPGSPPNSICSKCAMEEARLNGIES